MRVNRPSRTGTSTINPIDFCDYTQNWLTQIKFLGSYTLPYGIQVAATLQNQPGVERVGEVTYSNADLSAALGRPASAASADIDVISPGSVYGDRFNQFDLRLTKIISLGGGTQLRAMFDLFNLFNANAITRESVGYGGSTGGGVGWAAPQVIMAGRLAKFAFQFDF